MVQKRGGVPPSSFVQRAAVIVAALVLATTIAALSAAAAQAQDPSPTPLVAPTDTRSELLPPGLIGSPVVAALLVVGLGAVAFAGTALYVRLAGRQ
jgi:hypothetical protein